MSTTPPPPTTTSSHSSSSHSPTSLPTTTTTTTTTTTKQKDSIPTIRLIPYITDIHRGLNFPIIERKLPNGKVLRVKRFVEKGNVDMSDAIAFKSKVVSRQHGELWTQGMQFFYKDTKSSSGSFINNIRIAPANTESPPHQLKDGDIIQLGVDYQGRSEDIFRCVRMRVELNREAFKNRNNTFRTQVVRALKALATASDKDSTGTGDCCICLGSIAPFQALFIAPCCHSFHFKCVRPLLHTWPNFSCPLCRHFADLSASVSIDDLAFLSMDESPAPDDDVPVVGENEPVVNPSTPTPLDPYPNTLPVLLLPELPVNSSFIFSDDFATQSRTSPPLNAPEHGSMLPPSIAHPVDHVQTAPSSPLARSDHLSTPLDPAHASSLPELSSVSTPIQPISDTPSGTQSHTSITSAANTDVNSVRGSRPNVVFPTTESVPISTDSDQVPGPCIGPAPMPDTEPANGSPSPPNEECSPPVKVEDVSASDSAPELRSG